MYCIGQHAPKDLGEQLDYIYVEHTDMCYEIYADGIVGAYSDAVGLVTWYRMTAAEIDRLRATDRLEYLRGEIEAERISSGEIAELQELAPYIDRGDILLLQWAGVPEFESEDEQD